MIYLDLDDLPCIANRVVAEPTVRDIGLLRATPARPEAMAFGQDAYPDFWTKAAALLHSVVKNRALIDGNKRLALAATIGFLETDGHRLSLSTDQAYDLVGGTIDALDELATRLQGATGPDPVASSGREPSGRGGCATVRHRPMP